MVVDNLTDDEADQVFHALADATRRDILRRALREERSVSSIARHYGMSFAAVQKHVAVLERAHLVTKQKRGREQIVRGDTATLRRASVLLDAVAEIWTHRINQMADVLVGEGGSGS